MNTKNHLSTANSISCQEAVLVQTQKKVCFDPEFILVMQREENSNKTSK